jgi:hypothetical protein
MGSTLGGSSRHEVSLSFCFQDGHSVPARSQDVRSYRERSVCPPTACRNGSDNCSNAPLAARRMTCAGPTQASPTKQGAERPRRVIAKVEWHPGELYPRVDFIVTNMSTPAFDQKPRGEVRLDDNETRISGARRPVSPALCMGALMSRIWHCQNP